MLLQSGEATIETSNAGVAALLSSWLSALVTSGDMSSASEAAILAMTSVTSPAWQPPLEIADLQACQAQGCDELVAAFEQAHGISGEHHSAELAIETVYCLGNCALGPSAMVGSELVGRLDVARLAELCGLEVAL